MSIIDNVSKKLASDIAQALNFDDEKEEIIAYGAMSLIHTSFSTLLIMIFGIIFNSLTEILIISLTSAMLRQFSGGAHATSSNRCAVSSVLLFGSLSQMTKALTPVISSMQVIILQVVVILFVSLILYMLAPVDNPNKRITNKKMMKRLRKSSFIVVMIVELLTCILWIAYISGNTNNALGFIVSLHMGLLWQAISITFVGKFFIKGLDKLLMKMRI